MVKLGLLTAVAACSLFGGGCDMSMANLFGKEVGRIPFSAAGSGKTTVTLAAGDVSLWTALDISYEGDAALTYKVTLTQGDKVVASTTCNPLGELPTRTNFKNIDFNGKHSRSGNGKMVCDVRVPTAGPTTVDATLEWTRQPATVALRRADLVVKQ